MRASVLGIFVVAAMFMGACSNSSVSTYERGSAETLSDAMVNNSKEAYDKYKDAAQKAPKVEEVIAPVVAPTDSTAKADTTHKEGTHAEGTHKEGAAAAEPAKK